MDEIMSWFEGSKSNNESSEDWTSEECPGETSGVLRLATFFLIRLNRFKRGGSDGPVHVDTE